MEDHSEKARAILDFFSGEGVTNYSFGLEPNSSPKLRTFIDRRFPWAKRQYDLSALDPNAKDIYTEIARTKFSIRLRPGYIIDLFAFLA